jgi:hypothetical protein
MSAPRVGNPGASSSTVLRDIEWQAALRDRLEQREETFNQASLCCCSAPFTDADGVAWESRNAGCKVHPLNLTRYVEQPAQCLSDRIRDTRRHTHTGSGA